MCEKVGSIFCLCYSIHCDILGLDSIKRIILINVLFGSTGNVDHGGHIGGFLGKAYHNVTLRFHVVKLIFGSCRRGSFFLPIRASIRIYQATVSLRLADQHFCNLLAKIYTAIDIIIKLHCLSSLQETRDVHV